MKYCFREVKIVRSAILNVFPRREKMNHKDPSENLKGIYVVYSIELNIKHSLSMKQLNIKQYKH